MGNHIEFENFSSSGSTIPMVYFALNVEATQPEGNGHGFTTNKFPVDYKNHAWRLYGLREGVENILSLFLKHNLPISLLINSNALRQCANICPLINDLPNCEIIGHGVSNSDYFHELSSNDQKKQAIQVKSYLEKYFKKNVTGWLSPWINGNKHTIWALNSSGYQYTLDWSVSDYVGQLTDTKGNKIFSVPYNIEVNDTPSLCAKSLSAEDYTQSIFDYIKGVSLLPERDKRPVIALPFHTPVFGRPHRLVYLDKILTRLKCSHDQGQIQLTTPSSILKILGVIK
ncbi:hypothetical protein [Candidatus Sororendozoicomonas aggregata]|uniref:hypothetical protein n=1 Tax=Candidatus Sororendozoicomonas aggregata TaxID=3073239 RepID=UPI002ED443E9